MKNELNELSKNIFDWGERKTLWINSKRIDECMEFYLKNNLDGIGISPFNGYKEKNIDFLKNHSYVKGLILPYAKGIDISRIQELTELVYVSIADNKQAIDFSIFPKLEEIRVEWHRKMLIPEKLKKLKILSLRRYNPKSKDLSELAYISSLEDLAIVQSPIITINGIHRFRRLKRIQLSYLSKLKSLSAIKELSNGWLEILDCDKCRKIDDHDVVRHLHTLKILKFNDCGEIPSISFLNQMKSIHEFRFVNTNILNGDLHPCIKLKEVGFLKKAHYSHTPEQINDAIKKR